MAFLTANVFSESLQVGTTLDVVVPQSTRGQVGVAPVERPADGWPVLYLLHGLSDDHSAWVRHTSIERYARGAGLAVVMPAAGRSFYADEAHGHPYWTWISEELPRLVAELFRLSTRPQETYVAGLSMGGYGALRLGLTHPERFAGVASLSGPLDVHVLERPERKELLQRVFDGTIPAEAELPTLLGRLDPTTPPPLYLGCGTGEELLEDNRRFAEEAERAGLAVTTDFRPGTHAWELWDAMIRDVIAWLPRTG